MRILLLAILCVVYLPVYAEPLDPCATNGNLLWEGARTYEDSANRDQRIRSVIEQNAMGLDNVLTVAVWFGYGDIVSESLKDQHTVKEYGAQSLYLAASMGRLREMSMLLDGGVAPNSEIQDGLTPIYGAAEYGCVQAMQLLVDSGANVNHKANVVWTLLESTVISEKFDASRFLMKHGYNLDKDEKKRIKEILRQMHLESMIDYIFST